MRKLIFTALISILLSGCSESGSGELILVEPGSGDMFRFPYFLFIPDHVSQTEKTFIVIEPNNSGFADDDLQKHVEKAERTATKDYYLGNYVARKLKYPLIVPVFPRPATEWEIYTHALDRDVMLQKGNPLERLDIQLIEMFNDAKSKLKELNINTADQFLMLGFSASGTFANRFTLLHPNIVHAVAAGGLNGLLALPLDSLNGKQLNYPLGVNDLNDFLNHEFQKKDFLETPQFYFMGETDENDAIPYADAFNQDERELIYELLGKEMLHVRWKECENIYKQEGVNAAIKIYNNIGHEHPGKVKQEIVEFFNYCINK